MSTAENNIFKRIQIRVSEMGGRLFRINAGQGWTGSKIIKQGKNRLIIDARPFKGAQKGFVDGVGWIPITITKEMIGQTFPVFTAIETKVGKNTATPEQQHFIDRVIESNGIAGVVRSVEDLEQIVDIHSRP
jgi:hypothetical protein